MDFSSINWMATGVATLLSFVLGGLWYGPLFGKRWQGLVGLSDADIAAGNPVMIFGPAFVLTFVQATVLAALIAPRAGVTGGAGTGAILGAGLIATGFGVNYLFGREGATLWGIDAGFNVAQMTIMGAVIGAWP
jgi:hypothetical protein